MRRYVKHYIWFWTESFKFMKGTSRIFIIWGCIRMAPAFAKQMCEWDKMTKKHRDDWYINSDRTL
jgi:recombinational DNA repair ATPase RecF